MVLLSIQWGRSISNSTPIKNTVLTSPELRCRFWAALNGVQISQPKSIPLSPSFSVSLARVESSLVAHESRISCHLWGPYWPYQQTGNGLVKKGDIKKGSWSLSSAWLSNANMAFLFFFLACNLHAFSCFTLHIIQVFIRGFKSLEPAAVACFSGQFCVIFDNEVSTRCTSYHDFKK